MRADYDTVPCSAPQGIAIPSDHEITGWLLVAIDQETDNAKRRALENAAALMAQLRDELQAYRDAAEIDPTRPLSQQFRGWNMARLSQARKKTESALAIL